MSRLTGAIQGLILFSTALGLVFLWQAHSVLPSDVFDIIAFGWVLFALDSALTFVRPVVSYYLGLVLAAIALTLTLSQPAHFALVASGNLLAAVTIVLGSIAEGLLMDLAAYFAISQRRKDAWEWPGEKGVPAPDPDPATS